ncbi:M20 metallopeptidase family protein [Faecalibacterium prausnitzii]|uniref:M20 metallopeptidase family protein n=1 Tax=Faecalibacterium prausnitzii TaxID=853 RepID=UPI003B42BEB1
MDPKELMAEAAVLEPQLQNWRRTLHRHPEVGFDLPQTRALVKQALTEMGYTPQDCGKAGILVLAGGKKPGKTILLRGDMDALPVQEESGVDFASEVPGRMHGCGHDMHTAMMLGAAKLLKAHEEELEGTVKLEFQPAEEIFQGSPDMIANGLLENPKVDAAVMFHVLAGMPLPSGMVLVPGGGITMASCEQYHITVHGKGGHGSMPEACIDPITAAAHIHIALQEINSREMDPHSFGVFTTGRFQAGAASNVIPDTAEMWGTIRTIDPENKVGELIHKRMTEIAQGVAAAYRCTAEVGFSDYCPCMVVDRALAGNAMTYMTELVGQGAMDMSKLTGGKPGGGSEDFAFVSHEVPTVSMFLSAGHAKEGYAYGQHHPKVKFDDSILYEGSAAYSWFALRWLSEHK